MNLNELKERVSAAKAKRDFTKQRLAEIESRTKLLEDRRKGVDGAILAVQEAAALTQGKLVQRFTDIVQTCLDCVFPDSYKFKMEFVSKRNKTEVDIWLDKDGTRMDPMTSNGGGVVDVICFALRLACLTISDYDKVMLMDEPFPHVRGMAKSRLGELVSQVSKTIGVQVIMVADVSGSSVEADKTFNVSKVGGISQVEVREGR